MNRWDKLELSTLNEHTHILPVGHAQIKSFQDPELPTAYDRYQLKINDKAAALVREAADAVLFARFETELVKTNGKHEPSEGNRIMYTESRPAGTLRTALVCLFVWRWTGRRSATLSARSTGSRTRATAQVRIK
jgi:AAA domain